MLIIYQFLSSNPLKNSKFLNLQISGRHFISFENKKENNINYSKFGSKRNYLTFKSPFKNSRDYIRITIDSYLISDSKIKVNNEEYGTDNYGSLNMRVKYAFLYLDNIMPYIGLKIGQTHRPWLNFEGRNSWHHRAISKNFLGNSNSAKLTNSADFGVNLNSKFNYFSSEIGLFNGEGYNEIQKNNHLSFEWRLTAHILGRGNEKVKTSNNFSNISFFGQQNSKNSKYNGKDLNWIGLHFVYNQKDFLISTQIVKVNKSDDLYKGEGFSINSDYRYSKKASIFGRFDQFKMDLDKKDKKLYIVGVDYKYSENIIFILSLSKNGGTTILEENKYSKITLTTDVKW